MEFRILEKVWSGKEVKFSHLKVFGCVSYVHIDSDALVNLKQNLKYVFLLAMVMTKLAIGFRMNKTKKIIRSRNVIFNEQVMYKDRSTAVPNVTKIDQKKFEFVNLDELT